MQSEVTLAPELVRVLMHQARVDRRTLIRHLSNPPARSYAAGKRIHAALEAMGLEHLLLPATARTVPRGEKAA